MPDLYVKPAKGRRVRIPSLGFAVVPLEGVQAPDDVFLRRRLAAGDLVLAEPEAEPTPAEPSKPASA